MNILSRIGAALGFMTFCGLAQAYDATIEFSTLSNPAGVWQYGYSVGDGAYNFTRFDMPFNEGGGVGWRSSTYAASGAPAVWKNASDSALFGVAPGQVSLHPGRDPFSPAVLRFVAPTAGDYSFFVQFFEGDSGVMSGSVFVNGNLADPLARFPSTNGNPSTGGSIVMSAGDRFDVAVGNLGSFVEGNTPVQVIITSDSAPGGFPLRPVPEPQTVLMFAAGLVALALARWRRGSAIGGRPLHASRLTRSALERRRVSAPVRNGRR